MQFIREENEIIIKITEVCFFPLCLNKLTPVALGMDFAALTIVPMQFSQSSCACWGSCPSLALIMLLTAETCSGMCSESELLSLHWKKAL